MQKLALAAYSLLLDPVKNGGITEGSKLMNPKCTTVSRTFQYISGFLEVLRRVCSGKIFPALGSANHVHGRPEN